MSSDDGSFLDALSKLSPENVANYLDRGVDIAAAAVRDTLASQSWLPDSIRPKLPSKPLPSRSVMPVAGSYGLYTRVNRWVLDNKLMTGTFVLGIAATTFGLVHRGRRQYSKKRRAKRASNNARIEVVLLAGSPSEPILRSLALDLERRGFIVFIVCSDVEEEISVQNEGRQDVRPLSVDVSNPSLAIERFGSYLQTPQHAYPGAAPHHLTLTAMILIPSFTYPTTPLATLSAGAVSDIVQGRVILPILLTHSFLPLLTALPFPHPFHHPHPNPPPNPKVLVLTPSIIPSLNPAFHIPECTATAALTAFTQALTSELSPLSIPVTHFKLGTFDLSPLKSKSQRERWQADRAEMLRWPQEAREAYGENYIRMMENNGSRGKGGSPLRELHNAVFDVMETSDTWWRKDRGGVVRVGQGSGTYAFVGNWIPKGIVGWMMGMRTVQRTDIIERVEEDYSHMALSSRSIRSESDYVSNFARPETERSEFD